MADRGKGRALGMAGLAWCLGPVAAGAVEIDDFELRTTRDLVALCSVAPEDPLAGEALQACFGYLGGTSDFYRALTEGQGVARFICPGRELTREELAEIVVTWVGAHPGHLDELPVESVVRAAVARFPCDS